MAQTLITEQQVVDSEFLSEQELQDMKGQPDGIAPLDSNNKVPLVYLPDTQTGLTINQKSSDVLKNETPPTVPTLIYLTDQDKIVYINLTDGIWYYLSDDTPMGVDGQGTGTAGTYIESFEIQSDVDTYWEGNILTSGTSTTPEYWNRRSGSTPSNSTGPSAAFDGSYYMYTEVSSGANDDDFIMSTTNFANLTEIKFRYNMYGSDMGTLQVIVETLNSGNQVIWEVSGQQTTTNWLEAAIDTTGLNVSKVTFYYTNASGYRGDCAIDLVQLTSV